MSLRIKACGATDIGRVRETNQDAYCVDEAAGLFVVADGMGGHAAGEVASRETVDAISSGVAEKPLAGADDLEETLDYLTGLVLEANRRVQAIGARRPECEGLGTTVTAMLVRDSSAYIAQVGDSRAYLVRNGSLEQITDDHSWVNEQVKMGLLRPEEAETHYMKNIITRSIGHSDDLEVDTFVVELRAGDRFVLCSDGLSNMMSGQAILRLAREEPLDEAAGKLIRQANSAGGYDNITVVLVAVEA